MKLIGILAIGLLFSMTMAASHLVIVGDKYVWKRHSHESILDLVESVVKGEQTVGHAFNFFHIDGGVDQIQEILKDLPKEQILSLPLNDDIKNKIIAGMDKITEVAGTDSERDTDRKQIRMDAQELLKNRHLVDGQKKNVIILNQKADKGKRLLDEEIIIEPVVNQSQILDNITPYAVSGILISIFLTIALVVGFNCLLDLKTNDRFPRNMYQVGKES